MNSQACWLVCVCVCVFVCVCVCVSRSPSSPWQRGIPQEDRLKHWDWKNFKYLNTGSKTAASVHPQFIPSHHSILTPPFFSSRLFTPDIHLFLSPLPSFSLVISLFQNRPNEATKKNKVFLFTRRKSRKCVFHEFTVWPSPLPPLFFHLFLPQQLFSVFSSTGHYTHTQTHHH